MNNQDLDELKKSVKTMIIESLSLEDITPNEIDDDAPLFGDGLGLDSIDALELGVALKRRYQIDIKGESEEAIRNYFHSVSSLTELIKNKTN